MSLELMDNFINPDSNNVHLKVNEKKGLKALFKSEVDKVRGELLGQLASSFYYVYEDSIIEDVYHDIDQLRDVYGIGVVDKDNKPLGILLKNRMALLLGKRYGNDVYSKKKVSKILYKAKSYSYERNIFSIAEELQELLTMTENNYFVLTKQNGSFYGIFTARDMQVYLSLITQKDLAMARNLQLSIVKEKTDIHNNDFAISAETKMAKGVGGDYYNIFNYEKNKWLISLCDVSGKGVSASLVTTCISGMFNAYDFKSGVDLFINKMNSFIYKSFESEKFVTCALGDFDSSSGKINLYDIGHSYLYLFRKGKFFKINATGAGLPAGVMQDIDFTPNVLQLKNDDMLIFMTDGIAEQTDSQGVEYGDKRIVKILRENSAKGITHVRDEIIKNIYQFRGEQPQHDDITIVILHYKK